MFASLVQDHEYLRELILTASETAETRQVYDKCNVDIASPGFNKWLKIPALEKTVLELYRKQYNDDRELEYNFWINKYPTGAFQELHTHEAIPDRKAPIVSWCYFVVIPENSSSMIFPVDNGPDLIYNSIHEGYIAFFPPEAAHLVTPNQSEYERVTVAGNIFLKG